MIETNDNDDNAEVSNKAVNSFKLPVMKTSRQVVIPPSSDPEQEDESDALPDASGDASTTRQRNVLEVSPVLENKSRRRSTVPKEPNNKIKVQINLLVSHNKAKFWNRN